MSLRETILAARDIDREIVDVPEWGVSIEVRSMSAGARLSLLQHASQSGTVELNNMIPGLIVACCFDPESGDAIFTDKDASLLLAKNTRVIERLAEVAMKLSKMLPEAVDEGKDAS